jgi:hypothetical protein
MFFIHFTDAVTYLMMGGLGTPRNCELALEVHLYIGVLFKRCRNDLAALQVWSEKQLAITKLVNEKYHKMVQASMCGVGHFLYLSLYLLCLCIKQSYLALSLSLSLSITQLAHYQSLDLPFLTIHLSQLLSFSNAVSLPLSHSSILAIRTLCSQSLSA